MCTFAMFVFREQEMTHSFFFCFLKKALLLPEQVLTLNHKQRDKDITGFFSVNKQENGIEPM